MSDALSAPARRSVPLIVLALVGAALGIGITAWNLLWGGGPFLWHVAQPSSWQGALEALAVGAVIAAGFAINRGAALALLVGLPVLFYLRRHATDVPLLLDLILFEIVIGLGMALRRVAGLPRPTRSIDYLYALIAGLALWSVCAWTASALGFGSIKALRWLTLLLAIPAAFGGHRPLCVYVWRRIREQPRGARIAYAALATWLLVLFVRGRYAIGFDALWYGLRGEFVLAPGDSVFEPLGLVSPVYYFPKFYEMLLLPLSALGSNSAIGGLTVLMLVPLLMTCRLLMQAVAVPAAAHAGLLGLIATLPALANLAPDPKPDIPATLFVLLAALFGLTWLRTRHWTALAWMASATALACSIKMAAIPYAGVMVLTTLIAGLRGAGAPTDAAAQPAATERRLAVVALVLALITALFVLARTFVLAGLPTIGPDPLFKLWLALGFELREPAGTLAWTQVQDWREVPQLIVDWLLRPQRMPHVVVSWTGNAWLWMALLASVAAALGLRRATAVSRPWPLLALVAIGLALALGNRYLVRGGDGNYFLHALLPATILAGGALFGRLMSAPRAFAVALACLPAFAAFQAGYSFISGAWTPGTRAFDLEFGQSWRDLRRARNRELEWAGLTGIATYLREASGTPRVIGSVESQAMNWLPARFEDIATISFSHSDYVGSDAGLRRFVDRQRIEYLIAPLPDAGRKPPWTSPAYTAFFEEVRRTPGVRRIVDRRYELLDLSALDAAERARLLRSAP